MARKRSPIKTGMLVATAVWVGSCIVFGLSVISLTFSTADKIADDHYIPAGRQLAVTGGELFGQAINSAFSVCFLLTILYGVAMTVLLVVEHASKP